MSRLNKTLILSSLIISVIATEVYFCNSVFAQSNEARELNRKGVAALEAGKNGEAVQLLKKAMALEPKWGEPCHNAARLLKNMGNRTEMVKMLRKAYMVEPNNTAYAEEYLNVLIEDYEKAEKASNNSEMDNLRNEILMVNPGDLRFGLESVKSWIKADDEERALEEAEDLIAKNSRYRSNYEKSEMGELFYIVALISYGHDNLDKAKINAGAASRYDFSNKEDAEGLFRKVKNEIEEKVKELLEESEKLRKAKKYDGAVEKLEEVKRIQPDNESVSGLLIEIDNSKNIDKFIADANKHLRNNKWLEAREVLHNLLEKYPESEEGKKKLAELAPKEDELKKKIEVYDIPLTSKERERVLNEYKERGIKFYEVAKNEADKIEEASKIDISKFKEAIPPFQKALAFIEVDNNLIKYKSEIDDYLKKIKVIEDNYNTWIKSRDEREAGNYEEVLKNLKKLPENYDIQINSFFAEAYYKTGDNEKAESYANKQLVKQPENNRAKFVLGCIKLDSNDTEVAYKYFKEIFKTDPNYPELLDKMANSTKHFLPWIGIISIIVILLWIVYILYKRKPIYDKNFLIKKGKSSVKSKSFDEAIEIFLKVRHSPLLTPADNFEITKGLAQAYLNRGIYDRAIGECKHLISLSPNSEEAHTWLGFAYLGRRMLSPESLPELLNLYKKESRNIALVSLLGSYYAQQKKLPDEGVQVLEQWLNLDHDNIEVLKPLGKYYLNKKRTDDKAMKVFQKMMEIGSPDPDFMLGVANAYLKMRQFDNCLQLCEQVINNDINNADVHPILLDAYKKQNKLQELLDIYANFLQNNPYNVAFQNGLKAAQATYEKVQNRNAAQAANEAAAVMERMMNSQDESQYSEDYDEPANTDQEEDSEQQIEENQQNESDQTGETKTIACPQCGQLNPQGTYNCQNCGANFY